MPVKPVKPKAPKKKEDAELPVKKKKAVKYSEDDISYFETDLEKIRVKPQMFIGATDQTGVFTIIREPSDNGVDEARAGRNSLIHIFAEKGDAYWICDSGVGIPVKKHPKAKISTLTHVLTSLQSSGKMSGSAYKSAIGTHGVGLKASNALSESMEVWTYREDAKGWHYTKFEKGVEKVAVKKIKSGPKLPNGKTPKLGTVVRFVPDSTIFSSLKVDPAQIETWCEITSYMNAGLTLKFTDIKGKTKEFLSKDGITEYLVKRLAEFKATALNPKPLFHQSDTLELALSFADVEGTEIQFFTNTIRNVDEGFHADAFYKALAKSLDPYKGKLVYTPGDLKEGLVGILNYKIDAPQFSSQTKEKLVDVRMQVPCYDECLAVFESYWKANKTIAKQIVERAAVLRKKTSDFLKDKKLAKNVKSATKGLSTKFADCSPSKVPFPDRELYLVEGDSAGGCFTGDTDLLAWDGYSISYADLVNDFNAGKTHTLISYNETIKSFEPVILDTPHITKYTDKLIKVFLENSKFMGKESYAYQCTLDHKWLTKDGWVEAGQLKVGDSIINKSNAPIAVCKLEVLTLDEPVAVYDGTSPVNHNYLLSNGCVVHNTAKLARDKSFQATFSLKGKPLNVMEATKDKVNSNAEIAGIFAGIGLDLAADDPLSKLRFGKIIHLVDPDVDGRHINTLLFTVYFKYTPQLLELGQIYILVAPEYLCKYRSKVYFGATTEEIYKQTGTKKCDIRHIKGWGEIDSDDMRDIAFNKDTRKLVRVLMPKDKAAKESFAALMGKNTDYRKKLLGVV